MYIFGSIVATIVGSWFFKQLGLEPGYASSLIMGTCILYAILYEQKE